MGRNIMSSGKNRVCPVERAGSLDNRIRRWLQDPRNEKARAAGFTPVERPKVFLGKAVVMKKGQKTA